MHPPTWRSSAATERGISFIIIQFTYNIWLSIRRSIRFCSVSSRENFRRWGIRPQAEQSSYKTAMINTNASMLSSQRDIDYFLLCKASSKYCWTNYSNQLWTNYLFLCFKCICVQSIRVIENHIIIKWLAATKCIRMIYTCCFILKLLFYPIHTQ